MKAFLPPNSNVKGVIVAAALLLTAAPEAVEHLLDKRMSDKCIRNLRAETWYRMDNIWWEDGVDDFDPHEGERRLITWFGNHGVANSEARRLFASVWIGGQVKGKMPAHAPTGSYTIAQ